MVTPLASSTVTGAAPTDGCTTVMDHSLEP